MHPIRNPPTKRSHCNAVYYGPRCELCEGNNYFEKLDARCHDCGNIGMRTLAVVCALLFILLAAAATLRASTTRHGSRSRALHSLLGRIRSFVTLWRRAGMRYKVKASVGLMQCMSAAPSVYNVVTPSGLEEYSTLIHLLEFPLDLGISNIVPGSCIGNYHRRLLVGSSWPIAIMVVVCTCSICVELVGRRCVKYRSSGDRSTARIGLERTLPLMLLLTF
eukprot:6512516-Prymnesium_polylepis.2